MTATSFIDVLEMERDLPNITLIAVPELFGTMLIMYVIIHGQWIEIVQNRLLRLRLTPIQQNLAVLKVQH